MLDSTLICVPKVGGLPARAVVKRLDDHDNPIEVQVDNLRLRFKAHEVTISGSLPRYLRHENVFPTTVSDVRLAIEKLQDEFGIVLGDTRIWSMEIGQNLVMDYPVHEYLARWGPLRRFRRTTADDWSSVLYHNSRVSFQGYDKVAETGEENLPEAFQGKHALKLEQKYKRDIARIFGPLTLADLLAPDLWTQLIGRWRRLALKIPKYRVPRFDANHGTRGVTNSLAAMQLEVPGCREVCLATISNQRETPKETRSRQRAAISRLSTSPDWTDDRNDLNDELEAKICRAAKDFFGGFRAQS